MEQISLKTLLEAGCHFGHQVKRWHPKAHVFIYAVRDGIHIIDLAQTRDSMEKAGTFASDLGREGKILLFIATKRQAKGVVGEICKQLGVSYLSQRWIGGFLTNWDEVKKNLEKMRTMRNDRDTGTWNQFPKHEQVKLGKELAKLEGFYGGVSELTRLPDAVFVVDIRKEDAAVREATIRELPVIGVVDTNSDPTRVVYPIPANDDAVGSIEIITRYIAESYKEGQMRGEKDKAQKAKAAEAAAAKTEVKTPEKTEEKVETKPQATKTKEPVMPKSAATGDTASAAVPVVAKTMLKTAVKETVKKRGRKKKTE